jgi:hypothetical protein
MKTIRIALFAGLIILTQFNAVYAGFFETGNSLLEQWHASKRLLQNRNSCADGILAAQFLGHATGVAALVFDMPGGVTTGQLLDIVGRYLDSHPQERHEAGAILVVRALGTVFPLKK